MCDTYSQALEYAGLLEETVHCKKAVIVSVFFLYILNSIITGIIYFMKLKEKDEKIIKALTNFKTDIEQRSFFYLAFALLIQILSPVPFAVVMLYFYLLTFPLILVGHLRPECWKIRIAGIGLQILFTIIIIFIVMIDPWCRHYYYRYVVGVPPENYGIANTNNTTGNNGNNGTTNNNGNYTGDNLNTTTNTNDTSSGDTAILAFMMMSVIVSAEDTDTTNTTASEDTSTSSDTSTTPSSTDSSSTTGTTSTSTAKFRIDGIEPEAGPTTGKKYSLIYLLGETRVLVRGGPNFAQYQTLYPKPLCKFGHDDMVVEATYVLCTAAPTTIEEKEARHRDKNETCLQCDNSPATTKAEIIPFTISLSGDFSDVANSVPYRYYPPTRVYAIYPRYGPKDGDTVVQVWGENFLNFPETTRCAFGSKSVKATFINSNYMICVSPFSDVVEKPIPFTISLNNQQNSKDDLYFWYYSWPAITDLIPDRGPDSGGTKVLVRGRNFHPFKDHNIDNANDTFCMFENLAKVPATIINSTKVYCTSPPSYVLRQAIVEITLNNQQYTDDNTIFYYYRPPYLFDVNPRMGPVSGGTKVTAIGSNFRDTKNITCKFNETVVPGTFKSTSEIECYSPPNDKPGYVPLSVSLEMEMYSPSVQYLYYDVPVIDSIEPTCGPDYGFTQITVRGRNFLDMGHNKALCVFNKTIFMNATVMDQYIIKCDSPSLFNEQGYSIMSTDLVWYNVEITIDGGQVIAGPAQNFTYYKYSTLYDIVPNMGPIRGGTNVTIVGKGFNQPGACNKTARFAVIETKPINETNDTLMFVVSPPVKVPDEVVVAVALNGQQFIRDIIMHERDPQNTFIYYADPLITLFYPIAGPSIGGTQIRLNGLGFMPLKDSNGHPDRKRNRFYARFVDPDTDEELAPSTEVLNNDLFEDQAKWPTPPLPAGTKALLQISLNNQDWQSVPLPNKTYSFIYYESPHITKLYPTYGPVKSKVDIYMEIEGTNFICPDTNCTSLYVRFGEPDAAIYQKGTWINDTFVKCKIPKYTKPDVLRVEVTMNGNDYTNDQKTYGYFDPYVLNAEPRLISVDGTTKVKIKGFGFVNSNETKALFSSQNNTLLCSGAYCIKEATYIDKYTLETATFPQSSMNYNETEQNVLWDPINIDAAVYGSDLNDFTDNNIQLWYYEEPDYKNISTDESPANVENQIFINTDFKKNPIDRIKKYSNYTCRFKSEDGTKVMYTKGELERYPLEAGTPNSVQCKSPKWDLKGQDKTLGYEKVKLDLALNGQDFHGSFDFYFTQELYIHRTVPMAGPVQAYTKTRIIGTGYKPPKSQIQLKWGILNTTNIPKTQVEDYIYYKTQFENMIEGCEEIKAYVYEAQYIHKVDSVMEEGASYHSVYLESAQYKNWTKTHGGPYYVTVGKDIEVLYHSRVNYSYSINHTEYHTQNNSYINETTGETYYNSSLVPINITTTNYSEIEGVKQWLYYQYTPSMVEFYYYKDSVVKDMLPHSGVIVGGTSVHVSGAWFKYMPEYGVVPHCKFGDKIVRGDFDSTVRIVCKAPPGTELGTPMAFEVSMNGVDFTDTGMKFSYYDIPTLYNITPSCGPEAGGTMIYIFGANFSNMSSPNEFNCKFTPMTLPVPPKKMPAIYLNSSAIMCPSPGGWGQGDAVRLQVTFNGGDYDNNNFTFTFFSVTRAFPRSGPSDGSGGDILIDGFGFRNDTNPLCKINNTIYQPTSVTWNEIRCPVPRSNSGDNYFGNVNFQVSPNGMDWHNFLGGFQYYPQPIVDDIFPKQGPSMGVGVINFYGDGFRDDYNLVDLACKIGDAVGKAVYVSTKHVKCVIEDMELVNEGEFLPAQLALNRYSWTNLTNETYFLPYGISQIYPTGGPTTGVTDVVVQGKGFLDLEGSGARCRFGTPSNYAIVDGQILSYERIACKAPADFQAVSPAAYPEDVPFSIALSSDEFDPWTETSHKFRFYEQPVIVKCEPCEVDVGTISEVLVWADDSYSFFEPLPSSTPTDSEQSGQVTLGSGLSGIACKFGRFGETQAIYINSTVIKCITPAVEDDPDSIYREQVKLTVAMNGVDHDETTSQIDFTFVGTGTYLVFWPFIIGALLIGLLIVALIVCCSTLFQKISFDDFAKPNVGGEGQPHTFSLGRGVQVPRGRADWNNERSSVDILERVSGGQI